MYDKTQTSAVFTAAQAGLQNSLQYLLQNNKDGISRTSIYNAMYGINKNNTVSSNILNNTTTAINSPFYQMISGQFSTLDKNNDGILSPEEANGAITNLSSGLSRDQIILLRSQGAIDEELANKIISNFSKMDTNGDGKVSEAEINAFCLDDEKQAKVDESKDELIKNMSVFYDVDVEDVSSEEDS